MKVGFLGILAVLFIGLKLGNVITWSWWFVLLPLYGGIAIFIALFLAVIVLAMIHERVKR